MAHIKSVMIRGLAGRKDTYKVDLDRHVNIFYGRNGCGKTTLLRVINSAMEGNASLLRDTSVTYAEVVMHSLHAKTDFRFHISRDDINSSPPQRTRPRTLRRSDGGLFTTTEAVQSAVRWHSTPALPEDVNGRWAHEFLTTHRLYEHFFDHRSDAPDISSGTDLNFERGLQEYWLRFYSTLQHQIQAIQRRGMADILAALITRQPSQPVGPVDDPGRVYERLLNYFKATSGDEDDDTTLNFASQANFRRALTENPNIRPVVEVIDRIDADILRTQRPRTRLQEFVSRLITGPKSISISEVGISVTTADNLDIGIRSLSSGEKHVLLLLVGALRAEESSLIVDEPELSLHVDWQLPLLSMIRELNPACQVIAATHSPEILAEWPDSNIFRIG